MPIFKYEAIDSQGVTIKDEIEALSQKEAMSKIRNMGYFATRVQAQSGRRVTARAAAARPKTRSGAGGKVKVKLITQFARQLSTLQDAGLPILRSLRILEEQQETGLFKAGHFKKVIGFVADDIEGGSTLSEAMAKFPKAYDRLFVNMVAAGETGGVLDLILARIAEFMEKNQKLKSRVKSAMIYPSFVLIAAFVIVMLLMTFVIPTFSEVLTDMAGGEELPRITRAVLAVSEWIKKGSWDLKIWIIPIGGWAILVAVPFVIVFLYRLIKRFQTGRYVLDSIKLRLLIIGNLAGKVAVARWTRTLGTLIGAGVPILDAINTSSDTAGNEVYTRMLSNVHNSIRQGETFAAPLKQSKTVDAIVTNMVAVGEETGDLDKMLLKISDNYDEQVDVLVASLMSLLEPIMILLLGGIVLVIVLAVFLPMLKVIGTLGG